MLVSLNWLQTYFDKPLPSVQKIKEGITLHSFEVEEIISKNGDTVFDISVLPNRAHDSLCHHGIAKEISTIFEIPLSKKPFLKDQETSPLNKSLSISVETENVSRFSTVSLSGVKVKASPSWLKERLEALGQKPINNVVDVTNYVMLDLGQPLHAFDKDKLLVNGEPKIVVRESSEGEVVTTLDGIKRDLKEGVILITNGKKILGIGGIKGGKEAEITEETKNIVIEAANFEPQRTRKSSSILKLRTDASQRFENGISEVLTVYALNMAVELLKEMESFEEFKGYTDYYPKKKIPYMTGTSLSEINKLLGTKLSSGDVENILKKLNFNFQVVFPKEEVLKIGKENIGKPYKYGASLSYEAPEFFDCSSFTAFCFSRAGVSIPRVSIDQWFFGDKVSKEDLKEGDLIFSKGGEKIKTETVDFMKGLTLEGGVSHVGIYSGDGNAIHASSKNSKVVEEKLDNSIDFKDVIGFRRIIKEEKRFRVEVPFERLDIRNREDLIEEIGRIYGLFNIPSNLKNNEGGFSVNKSYYYESKIKKIFFDLGFSEVITYAMKESGDVQIENPLASDKSYMRDSLGESLNVSINQNLKNLPLLGTDSVRIFEIGRVFKKDEEKTWLAFGVGLPTKTKNKEEETRKMLSDVVSKLEEVLGLTLDFKKGPSVWETDLEAVFSELSDPGIYDDKIPQTTVNYKHFSSYPFVLRDMALFVPESISSSQVEEMITNAGVENLVRINLFDEYRKEGKVSYAFRLVFQSFEKTLSDEEVNKEMEKIVSKVSKNKGFEVR